MDLNLNWTNKSSLRNELTMKYEPVQPFFFLNLLKATNCEIVFDIGANIGFYTFLSTLSERVKEIHSFEAIESTFLELEKNVSMNSFSTKIHTHNIAASDKVESLTFLVQNNDLSGINSAKKSTFHNKDIFSEELKVDANTIDNLANYNNVTIGLKIDVEGHEESVLEGAKQLLQNNQCVIQIESYANNKNKLENLFHSLGYSKFFQIGNDLYFSNITLFKTEKNVLPVLETSLANLIDNNLGKWNTGDSSYNNDIFLDLNLGIIDNKIIADCTKISSEFSAEVEYAFYLLIDNERKDVFWYSNESKIEINLPQSISTDRISISCFVREKTNPNKKTSYTKPLI